jgi:hypothetical protein
MSEIDNLLNDIKKLKKNLEALIDLKNGNLLEPEVLAASQMLNVAIVEYNKIVQRKLYRDKEEI